MNQTENAIKCGGCARTYKWKAELAGKKAKCKCGGSVRFPASDPAPAAMKELDLLDDPMVGGGREKVAGEYDLNEPIKPPAPKAPPMAPAVPNGRGAAGGPVCKGCGAGLQAGAVLCTGCGMNQKTGKKLGTAVERGAPMAGRAGGAAAKAPAPGGGWASSVWVWIGGVVALAAVVGLVGMLVIPGKTGVNVCLGVAIGGLIIHVLGTIWGLRAATGDNIALRLACRFVPFLALVLIIIKSVNDWEEMKGAVLTMLTGIAVGGMGLVMWLVAAARLGIEAGQ